MKKIKKFLSVLLAVLIFMSIVPMSDMGIEARAAYENTHTNTGNQAYDIVEVAKTQRGYTEGENKDNKYGARFKANNTDWCAYFVSWCAEEAGISDSIIHRQGYASPFSGYFNIPNTHGQSNYFPKPGDLVFYGPNAKGDHYHVGIVETADKSTGYITTIEGNTHDGKNTYRYYVYRHKRHYQDNKICCYGTPNYKNTSVSHTVDSSYSKNFTAYLKNPSQQVPVYNSDHSVQSGRYVTGSDPCTIHEVYTDGCCKFSYTTDSGTTRTCYTSYSYFQVKHTHNYSGSKVYETAHPHAIKQRCVDYSTCGGYKYTGEYKTVNSCSQCWTATWSLSQSSVSVKVGESKTIDCVINGVWPDSKVATGEGNSDIFDVTVGKNILTIKGKKVGSGSYKMCIWSDSSKTTLIGSKTIPITVTGDIYTITYNANGGTGAPSSQKKTQGTDLTLSSAEPTRAGYSFRGWSTSSSAKTPTYIPGDTYSANSGATLYAVWKKVFYGDAYNDGVVNIADIEYINKVINGNETASSFACLLGDVDGNGKLEFDDVLLINKYRTKKIHSFPVEDFYTKIDVYNMPSKTLYKQGETINTTGLKLAVLYYDSASASTYKSYHIINNGYSISPKTASGSGNQTVTVSVGDLKTSYSIYVDSTVPTGKIYIYNDVDNQQTIAINASDDKAVVGYYWGTSATVANNTFYTVSGKSYLSTPFAIDKEGTYYLTVKDSVGNYSKTNSFVFNKVNFNANKGYVTSPYRIILNSDSITLPSATRSGYTLKGWSTSSTATKAEYAVGGTYKVSSNVTLYAVWEANHTHSYISMVTTAATCKSYGIKTYKCENCTASYIETIAKNASNHAGGTEVKNVRTATCTAEGYTGDTYCKGCGVKIKTGTTIPKLSHTYGKYVSDKNATYKKDGTKTAKCTVCGKKKTVTEEGTRLVVKRPSTVKVEQSTSSIKLTWSKCTGADGYGVYLKKSSGWSLLGTTSKLTGTIKKLKAGTTYTFAVQPYVIINGSKVGGEYISLTVSTLPATPTAKVSSTSKGKVTVSWNAVTGGQKYQLYYKVGNGSYKLYKTYNGGQNLTFKNLKSGSKYTFAVRAYRTVNEKVYYSSYKPVTVTIK